MAVTLPPRSGYVARNAALIVGGIVLVVVVSFAVEPSIAIRNVTVTGLAQAPSYDSTPLTVSFADVSNGKTYATPVYGQHYSLDLPNGDTFSATLIYEGPSAVGSLLVKQSCQTGSLSLMSYTTTRTYDVACSG